MPFVKSEWEQGSLRALGQWGQGSIRFFGQWGQGPRDNLCPWLMGTGGIFVHLIKVAAGKVSCHTL